MGKWDNLKPHPELGSMLSDLQNHMTLNGEIQDFVDEHRPKIQRIIDGLPGDIKKMKPWFRWPRNKVTKGILRPMLETQFGYDAGVRHVIAVFEAVMNQKH